MNLARIIISCLYAGLMALAALAQLRQAKRLDGLMLLGAALVIAANFIGPSAGLIAAIAGLLVIHAAALLNGRRNGKITISHHLVRLGISGGIIALFLLS